MVIKLNDLCVFRVCFGHWSAHFLQSTRAYCYRTSLRTLFTPDFFKTHVTATMAKRVAWVVCFVQSLCLKRCPDSGPPVGARAPAPTVPSLYQHPPRRQIPPNFFGIEPGHLFKKQDKNHAQSNKQQLAETLPVPELSSLCSSEAGGYIVVGSGTG